MNNYQPNLIASLAIGDMSYANDNGAVIVQEYPCKVGPTYSVGIRAGVLPNGEEQEWHDSRSEAIAAALNLVREIEIEYLAERIDEQRALSAR